MGAEIGDSFGTDFGGQIAKSSAVAIANAATRSAIEGSSFGDNIIAAIPDVIGQAVGGKLGEALLNTFNPPTANPKVIQVASNNPEQVFGAVARVDENGNIVDEVVTTGQKRGFFGRVFNDGVKVGAASAGLGLGFFKGVGESAFGLVKDIGTLILNPIDTGKAVISGVGSGISYIGDVATGEANLKANISGLVSRGGGAIDNYITDRISTVQAAIDGDIGDAFGAGFKIGDDIGTAGFNVVATVGTGGAGFVAVKTGAKVVAKAVRETDFADAARRFTADESGAVPIPFNTGKKLFPNQLPGNLKAELALASRLGVNAISPKGPEFARIANNGTLKFAILENGKLKVIPHTVDGNEISHAVLSKGAPVRAAGEVDIAVAGNKAFGIDIRPHSGHFNFGNNNATNALILNRGRAAFQEFGIKFDGK